jgi:ADP-ribose pyrophosphatase YjhB (NUDIX family)
MAPRRNKSRDLVGRLATQSGPRTSAPMWPRPYFTPGEWAVYTSLWSYPNDSVFPTHQDLADRAWVERGTAADAVAKMDKLGLLERDPGEREDGSTSSNTYFLVEIPTAEHLKALEAKKVERAAEQEAKRKKRKAANRKYEKPQASRSAGDAEGRYGHEGTPVRATRGGTATEVPPGYGDGSTPGGTVQAVPGSGEGRTQESLGLSVGSSLDLGVTPSLLNTEEKKDQLSPETENQEIEEAEETAASVKRPVVLPTLTDWEKDLLEECLRVASSQWDRLSVRKVLGSRKIREITARDPELVRRAFLVGAENRDAVNLPIRMWHVAECPHWHAAERALADERAPKASGADAEAAPEPRVVAAPSRSQESPERTEIQFGSAAEARAYAAAQIAAGGSKFAASAPAPRSHRETMAMLDQVIVGEAGAVR